MSLIAREYLCPAGHRHAAIVPRSEDPLETACGVCGEVAERVISAPRLKFPRASVTRGKSDERPPGVPDTSLLADGMPRSEWEAMYREPQERDEDLEREVRRVRSLPDSRIHEL